MRHDILACFAWTVGKILAVMLGALLLHTVIPTRKVIHLLVGPVFVASVDGLRQLGPTVAERLAFSAIPLLSVVIFMASKDVRPLWFVFDLVRKSGP